MGCGSLLALLVECASWLFAFVAACLIHCRGDGKQVALRESQERHFLPKQCAPVRTSAHTLVHNGRGILGRYGEQIPPLPRGQFFGKMLPKFVFERRKQLQK